ncbi:unnamed protein product [Prunus armeniaca]|uniref:KIB1-4 beta-propeller domain-containing protein n=1 Tax=Prunus armeniaca TaxID=36596 RepID=A0A6J5TES8_PRUAR|nr:unnamed protein product [Prunus armeniaca]
MADKTPLRSSKSPSSLACLPEPPWIVLHKYDDDVGFRFRTLKGKIYHLKDPPGKLRHADVICLGSSHGWLLFLRNKEQKQLRPLLLNPLSGIQLLLPSFQTCPHIISITYPKIPTRIGHAYCRIKSNKCIHTNPITPERCCMGSVEDMARRISKVVLSSRPTCSSNQNNNDKIVVLVMYTFKNGWLEQDQINFLAVHFLMFCTTTDGTWRKLGKQAQYIDITSSNNKFYALRLDFCVHVWDFPDSSPVKKLKIRPHNASAIVEQVKNKDQLHRAYIIKTGEDLFLILRIYESWSHTADKTISFRVYNLGLIDGKCGWMEVESIGNWAFVLGSKQSTVMICSGDGSEWEENSIYFTEMPYLKGHLGVFNLSDKRVKKVCDLPQRPPYSPDLWLDPKF